jgi:hypothetical protein
VPDPDMKDMPSGFAVKGLVGAILGAVFGGVAVASIAVFACLHFRRRRRAAEAAGALKYDAYGKSVGRTAEKARGSSSGGTTNADVEMQKMTPRTRAVDAEEALRMSRATHSRRASRDHTSPRASEPERSISPVSDIAIEATPPLTAKTTLNSAKKLAAPKPVRAASR